MGKFRNELSWAGIIALGLASGVLEDVIFIGILVPYLPPSWDLTGNLIWVFTVPLVQLMTLAVTGTMAWFLGLRHPARLIAFWICWSVARTILLTLFNNPLEDIMVYLLWIAIWCGLIWLVVCFAGKRPEGLARKGESR